MKTNRTVALVAGLLLAGATLATGADYARAEDHAHGLWHRYADMHATISHSNFADGDKARLHEAVGHAADMESARHQAELLHQQQSLETDPQTQQELQDRIDSLHADFDAAQSQGRDAMGSDMSQVTQVGDTISNLISQVNSMINDSAWKETH